MFLRRIKNKDARDTQTIPINNLPRYLWRGFARERRAARKKGGGERRALPRLNTPRCPPPPPPCQRAGPITPEPSKTPRAPAGAIINLIPATTIMGQPDLPTIPANRSRNLGARGCPPPPVVVAAVVVFPPPHTSTTKLLSLLVRD
jgi:hypothetical protein